MSRYRPSDRKLYVGDLGSAASRQELEDAFSYYGTIRDVWVARNPPGFAFIEFDDARDAEDAKRGLDGRTVCGRRVRVEMSNGRGGRGGGSQRGRAFHPDDRCYECGENGHYARDCRRRGSRGGGGGGSGRRRSYSPRRRSASRSRSRDRRTRSRSRSPRRSKSRSRDRAHSRSKSADNRSRSRSVSKNRSRSKSRD